MKLENTDEFIQLCENNIIHLNSEVVLESNKSRPGYEERTYVISAKTEQFKVIESIFAYIEYLGAIGHSSGFNISVDGDGSARIQIFDNNGKYS